MWLLIRASTNDDGHTVLYYLNEHFKNIKGWLKLVTTDTCVVCNVQVKKCSCGQKHASCAEHLVATECTVQETDNNDDDIMDMDKNNELPPNIDINDDENAPNSAKRDLKESFTIGALGNDSKMHGENNWPKTGITGRRGQGPTSWRPQNNIISFGQHLSRYW